MPSILGFDPRYQFIGEDDIAGVLEHATRHDLPGIYNAAGDGVLVLSEVASLLGKPLAPVLPPWGTGLAAAALRRTGLKIPPEMLQQLRYGRASTTGASRRPATRSAPRRARPCRRSPSTCACAGCALRSARATSTSATSRSSCAGALPCGATTGSAWSG